MISEIKTTGFGPRTDPVHHLHSWFGTNRRRSWSVAAPLCRWQSDLWHLSAYCHLQFAGRYLFGCRRHIYLDAL